VFLVGEKRDLAINFFLQKILKRDIRLNILINIKHPITSDCFLFDVIVPKPGSKHAVLVIGLYELLGNPTT
jgi:uncharacterized membrane protein